MFCSEIFAEKILSRTQITLADYVINHYVGCQFGCLYCYARYSKRCQKHKREWGTFVDVKINAPELLEVELSKLKVTPKKILIGSITEVYQPLEKKYGLTRKILKILAARQIQPIILTRSSLILRDLDILKTIPAATIFFTLTNPNYDMINLFERNTDTYSRRIETMTALAQAGINVWAHIGPIIPFFTDILQIINDLRGIVRKIEFENLNKNSAPFTELLGLLKSLDIRAATQVEDLYKSEDIYNDYWQNAATQISDTCVSADLKFHIAFGKLNAHFTPKKQTEIIN